MKLSRAELAVLAVTAVLLALMGGYYLGVGRTRPMSPAGTAAEEPADVSPEPPRESEETENRVDLNTAGLEELMTLPGIGEKRARAILDYREEHGPFAYVEDLIRVPGIGEGILEGLMGQVTAGGTKYAEDTGS